MKRLVLLIAGLLALAGCSSSSAVSTVNAQDFATTIATSGVVILDVRTPGEFAAGHIAGAINIDVESGNFESDIAGLDKNTTYAVYCHSGRRSGIATNTMADQGFTHLYNLDGGIGAWTAAGQQLVMG